MVEFTEKEIEFNIDMLLFARKKLSKHDKNLGLNKHRIEMIDRLTYKFDKMKEEQYG